MTKPRLLGIFAHPDDESFGPGATLAKYARDGVEVHVCTVTDGAAGWSSPHTELPNGASSLVELRLRELQCACRVLGTRLHTLHYRDSGMEGSPDNAHPESLYQADLEMVANDLRRVIDEVKPHVIITHDPAGGYFHPDHIKVNHAVCCALSKIEDAATWQPTRVYYYIIPHSSLKWFIFMLRLTGRDPRRFGENGDIDLTRVGLPDELIHVKLDVAPYIDIKEMASACHKSQMGQSSGGLSRIIPALLRPFMRRGRLRYEHYTQAYPEGARPHRDLFEGVVI